MPQMRFQVRWPDETSSWCYSPSLIIKEFFTVGESYPLPDFVRRSEEALTIAGERVKQKYGFYCTHASSQLAEIRETAARFDGQFDTKVRIEAFEE
jgi:uncharacterized repeat protein (TIGR04042 family)